MASTFTIDNLPPDLYQKTAAWLFGGAGSGLGIISDAMHASSKPLVESIRQNVYRFSAAKTYQQMKVFSSAMTDRAGNCASL